MSEVSMNYMISNVEAMYPKLNRTYKFDNKEQRSVPCEPLDDGSEYSVNFRMSQDQAKNLFKAMSAAYKAKREDSWPEKIEIPFKKEEDGTFTHKAKLKGAYGKDVTRAPMQVDSTNVRLGGDFLLTTGSTVNINMALNPYTGSMGTGVSLRLKAVQVITYKPMENTSPFGVVEGGFTAEASEDVSPFGEVAVAVAVAPPAPPAAVVADGDDWGDDTADTAVAEPKKVVKKSAPAKVAKDELADVLADWDD